MPAPFSPDELALLAGIHADPDDDLLRLVYADWLEEHGQPEHAEFIRLQCTEPMVWLYTRRPDEIGYAGSTSSYRDDPLVRKKVARLKALFPIVEREERYGLHPAFNPARMHAGGLPIVDAVTNCGNADDPADASELLERAGPLPRFRLRVETNRVADLLDSPWMGRVDELELGTRWRDDARTAGTRRDATDEFWERTIPLLADHPAVHRLACIRLIDCDYPRPRARSRRNSGLALRLFSGLPVGLSLARSSSLELGD